MSFAMVIPPRSRDLGGLAVRRALPWRMRRTVGPFIFFDHMGPARFAAGEGIDAAPHPHVGLATVTYLFDGELLHRDSLGTEQPIRPGDVNWMTAGRGIAHSERTPAARRSTGSTAHALQLWVALPDALEETPPWFEHVDRAALPEIEHPGVRMRVIAGTAYGATSPVRVSSPLFYVDVTLEAGAELVLPGDHAERALYVVDGAVEHDGARVDEAHLAVAAEGEVAVRAVGPSRVVLIGGEPVGPRLIWWNFVASRQALIDRAKGRVASWRSRHPRRRRRARAPARTGEAMSEAIEVRHEEADGRGAFFVERGGVRLAVETYVRAGEHRVIIDHTQVDEKLQGHGVARKLLDAAVAWARETGTRVHATCPYARAQFAKDPSIRDVYEG